MSEIERIRAQYRPDRQISLRVLDVWLTVHTNDARIVVGLSQYFSPSSPNGPRPTPPPSSSCRARRCTTRRASGTYPAAR